MVCTSAGQSDEFPVQYSAMSHSVLIALHWVPYGTNWQVLLQQGSALHWAPLTSWQESALQQGSVHSFWLPQSQISSPSLIPLPHTGSLRVVEGSLKRHASKFKLSVKPSVRSDILQLLHWVGGGKLDTAAMIQPLVPLSGQLQFLLSISDIDKSRLSCKWQVEYYRCYFTIMNHVKNVSKFMSSCARSWSNATTAILSQSNWMCVRTHSTNVCKPHSVTI